MEPTDHVDAAPRFLARLVVVVAVVCGLLFLIVPLCTDGMATMPAAEPAVATAASGPMRDVMPMGAASGSWCRAPAAMAGAGEHCDVGAAALTSNPADVPFPGGLLATCIAFVIAILAVACGMRPPGAVRGAAPRRPTGVRLNVVERCVRHQALTELCILRV